MSFYATTDSRGILVLYGQLSHITQVALEYDNATQFLSSLTSMRESSSCCNWLDNHNNFSLSQAWNDNGHLFFVLYILAMGLEDSKRIACYSVRKR